MANRMAAAGPVEGPWVLPVGWRWEPISAVCRSIEKGTPASRFVENFRYTDVGGIGEGVEAKVVPVAEAPSRARQFVRSGDTLFSGVRVNLRRTVFVKPDMTDVASTAFSVLSPGSEIEPSYLYRWMTSDFLVDSLIPLQRGSQPPAVLDDDVRAQPIAVPPLAVQARIVARIDELFAEIDDGEAALARARDDLATWRKALLKAAVTGELTADWRAANRSTETGADLLGRILAERRARWRAEPRNAGRHYKEPASANTSDLPSLPAGWSWASLAQIAFVSGGLTVDAKRKPIDPVELPYMRVANVQRGHLDLRAMKTVTIDRSAVGALALASGDILLNEGGDRDKIGRGWVYEGQLPVCLHQNHVFKARLAHDAVSPYLVSMYLNELGRRFFIDQGKQTTNLASISLSKVSTAPIPVPPAPEAAQILRVYDGQSLPGIGTDMDDMRIAAATLRQSILAAAFRGDLA